MSNATWMSDMASKVGGRKLKEVALPGTHDSGTYGISANSDFSPDNPNGAKDFIKKYLESVPYLDLPAKKVFAGWAKSQGKNITDQLEAGIRYLDLRVSRRSGNDMYIVHGMYAENVNVVIDAVHTFVTNNDKEIVILDFNHFYEMTTDSHNALVSKLISTFGDILAPRSFTVDATVNDLWAKRQRVIVLYGNGDAVTANAQLWSQSSISSPWPNKTDTSSLKNALEGELPNKRDTFFVLQGVLTPDGEMIKKGFIPGHWHSLEDVAKDTTPKVVGWIKDLWANQNLNIVIVDWFEVSNYVDVVKSLN
jgi:hypothetical protein